MGNVIQIEDNRVYGPLEKSRETVRLLSMETFSHSHAGAIFLCATDWVERILFPTLPYLIFLMVHIHL